jgi:uncharacterized Zn finger protein (UPF0148 family)
MTRYARSDQFLISQAGGCGNQHARPKNDDGEHVSLWALECPECEVTLTNDPHWSGNTSEVPLTPEEERAKDKLVTEGNATVQQMTAALAALFAQGVTKQSQTGGATCKCGAVSQAGARFCATCGTPFAQGQAVVQASVEKPATLDLGAPEATPAAKPTSVHTPPKDELEKVHTLTLKKMARAAGLSDAGPREKLIDRLVKANNEG